MARINAISILSLVLLFVVLVATPVGADVGVGLDLAKIAVDEPLIPGETYHLPLIGVINTGTQACDYVVTISSVHDQPQIAPPADWFYLQPETVRLEPGDSQEVEIQLTIPFKAQPGEYFALIEASPTSAGGFSGGDRDCGGYQAILYG